MYKISDAVWDGNFFESLIECLAWGDLASPPQGRLTHPSRCIDCPLPSSVPFS